MVSMSVSGAFNLLFIYLHGIYLKILLCIKINSCCRLAVAVIAKLKNIFSFRRQANFYKAQAQELLTPIKVCKNRRLRQSFSVNTNNEKESSSQSNESIKKQTNQSLNAAVGEDALNQEYLPKSKKFLSLWEYEPYITQKIPI